MDASKRRRVQVDRLGDLPDCLLHDVISHLGSRLVVQTSVLSWRWRHLWRDVLRANIVIDEQEFAGDKRERLDDFADIMVPSWIPPETPHLDAFRLNLVNGGSCRCGSAFADRWIRRGLRRVPATVDIRAAHGGIIYWRPHRSYGTATQMGSCAAGFTRRLTTLRLIGVVLVPGFLEDLGRYCPALEDLHVESCQMESTLHGAMAIAISSPTLHSLVLVEPLACTHLSIAAPRLTNMRLELAYDGYDCHCFAAGLATRPEPPPSLVSLVEASIRLTDTSYDVQRNQRARNKGKLEFFKFMRGFLALLPNVVRLHLAGFTPTALLAEESQEFPVLHSLKTFILEGCDVGLKLQALTGILCNTNELEKLGLHHCTFVVKKRRRRSKGQQAPKRRRKVLWCQKLKSIQVKIRQEDERHLAVNVFSKISKGMKLRQWMQVKTSCAIV